jgi:NAD(P)-dependent dehydrogenase (short-subunit alcohol dehydrogenase family)
MTGGSDKKQLLNILVGAIVNHLSSLLFTVWLMYQKAGAMMTEQGYGRIINISSCSGLVGVINLGVTKCTNVLMQIVTVR